MLERRHFPREKVERLAYLCVGERRFAVTLTELSEGGARLRVEQSWRLPGSFAVYLPGEQLVAAALMVWRAGREVGVAFSEPLRPVALHPDPAMRELALLHAFAHLPGRPGAPGVEPGAKPAALAGEPPA